MLISFPYPLNVPAKITFPFLIERTWELCGALKSIPLWCLVLFRTGCFLFPNLLEIEVSIIGKTVASSALFSAEIIVGIKRETKITEKIFIDFSKQGRFLFLKQLVQSFTFSANK